MNCVYNSTELSATANIPGKLMLNGEYAVLYGERSLSIAVDYHMQISIKVIPGSKDLVIASNLWSENKICSLDKIPDADTDMLQALALDLYRQAASDPGGSAEGGTPSATKKPGGSAKGGTPSATKKPGGSAEGGTPFATDGLQISVESQLNPTYGLGSSSALALGINLCIHTLFKRSELSNQEKQQALKQAFLWQKNRQGQASGYDFLTQFWNTSLLYQAPQDAEQWPGPIQQVQIPLLLQHLYVFVGGKGADTKQVMNNTLSYLLQNQQLNTLLSISREVTDHMLAFDHSSSSQKHLWMSLKKQRALFALTPSYPQHLAQQLDSLAGLDETWSYKTSGAGGEDALLIFATKQSLIAVQRCLEKQGWKLLT